LVLIALNKFLVADANVDVTKTLIDKYKNKESATLSSDAYGLSLTLKTDAATTYTFDRAIAMEQYSSSVVRRLSDLFMYKVDINAEAVFTTPVYFPGQPQLVMNYGRYALPTELFVMNNTKTLVPWSNIISQKGDINDIKVVLNKPHDPTDGYTRGLITVRRPGIYMVTGFIQLNNVTSQLDSMEVSLLINKNSGNNFFQASKIGPIKDGGVPFCFVALITEELINAVSTAAATLKPQGEAYIQLNVETKRAAGVLNCPFIRDEGRYHWCAVTFLG